jgi:hypothetical protein
MDLAQMIKQVIHQQLPLMGKQLHLDQSHQAYAIAAVEQVIMHQIAMQRRMWDGNSRVYSRCSNRL